MLSPTIINKALPPLLHECCTGHLAALCRCSSGCLGRISPIIPQLAFGVDEPATSRVFPSHHSFITCCSFRWALFLRFFSKAASRSGALKVSFLSFCFCLYFPSMSLSQVYVSVSCVSVALTIALSKALSCRARPVPAWTSCSVALSLIEGLVRLLEIRLHRRSDDVAADLHNAPLRTDRVLLVGYRIFCEPSL